MSESLDVYRELPPPGEHRLRAVWAICRWNLRIILRRKLFWLLVSLGMFHFLLHFAVIYVKAQILVQNPNIKRVLDMYLVTGTGDAYREFIRDQSKAIVILLGYAGVVLITSDLRHGGLAFYLSKSVGVIHYASGKLLTLFFLTGMLTLAPALVLFGAYGVFSNTTMDYWLQNKQIAVGIAGYSIIEMAMLSLPALAIGLWCRRPTPFVACWAGAFIVLPALAELLRFVFDSSYFRLLDPWHSIDILGDLCFGASTSAEEWKHVWWCIGLVGLMIGLSGYTYVKRIAAVEIVE